MSNKITVMAEELREFLQKGKNIRQNNLIPILDYIKLEGQHLFKSNMQTFLRYTLNVDTEATLLIDEKVLTGFLVIAEGDTIAFIHSGDKVVITDGVQEQSYAAGDAHLYPAWPEPTAEERARITAGIKPKLPGPLLKSLGVGKEVTLDNNEYHTLGYIHIKNGRVLASDGHFTFAYDGSAEKTLANTTIVLDRANAAIISDCDELTYSEYGNYNVFEGLKLAWGFIKCTHKTPDFDKILNGCKFSPKFTINRDHLIRFCEGVQASTAAKLPMCSLAFNGTAVNLRLEDAEFQVYNNVSWPGKGDFIFSEPKFFSYRDYMAYFRRLPYKTLNFSPYGNPNYLTIWSDEDTNFRGTLANLQY